MTLLRIKDGGDHAGAPGRPGAIYLATMTGPVHVVGAEFASISDPSVIYVDSWARLLQLAPVAGAPSDAQVHDLGKAIAAELVARLDTPLGEYDEPAIVETVRRAVRELLGTAAPVAG